MDLIPSFSGSVVHAGESFVPRMGVVTEMLHQELNILSLKPSTGSGGDGTGSVATAVVTVKGEEAGITLSILHRNVKFFGVVDAIGACGFGGMLLVWSKTS